MITLAIIGIGGWGMNYVNTIKYIKNVRLKYVCSTNRKNLDRLPGEFIKLDSYKDLFLYKNIDGIILATPAPTHFEIAKDLLLKGYNVLIEKPLTTSYKDALVLKAIYEKINKTVMVGHIYLYNPAFIKTCTILDKVGEIKYLDLEASNWSPIRDNISALWDWAPHDISMCLEVMKEEPVEVQGWGINILKHIPEKESDIFYLRLGFSHGVQALIRIATLSPIKKRKVNIVGSKGSILFNDTENKKIQFLKGKGTFYPSYSNKKPLLMEVMDFVNCIKTKKIPRSDLYLGVRVSKIIHHIEQSINRSGTTVKILT